jgi:hypothetical protein
VLNAFLALNQQAMANSVLNASGLEEAILKGSNVNLAALFFVSIHEINIRRHVIVPTAQTLSYA